MLDSEAPAVTHWSWKFIAPSHKHTFSYPNFIFNYPSTLFFARPIFLPTPRHPSFFPRSARHDNTVCHSHAMNTETKGKHQKLKFIAKVSRFRSPGAPRDKFNFMALPCFIARSCEKKVLQFIAFFSLLHRKLLLSLLNEFIQHLKFNYDIFCHTGALFASLRCWNNYSDFRKSFSRKETSAKHSRQFNAMQ